jgi:hypothetical protein
VVTSIEQLAGRGGLVRASADLLRRSAGALKGVTLAFELHGPNPDAHAQVPRSVFSLDAPETFDGTVTAIDHARAHGLPVVVVSTVSRSNMRVLREQGSLVARLGASDWLLRAPWTSPELAPPQLPRAAMATPFVLDAAVRARRAGLHAWLHGFPLCLLGPHAGLALEARVPAVGAPCADCPSRTSCGGLGADYRARFGGGELRATPSRPSQVSPLLSALLDGLA